MSQTLITQVTDLIGKLNSLVSELDDLQEETQVLRDEHQSFQADLKTLRAEKKKLQELLRFERGIRSELEAQTDEQKILIATLQADLREILQ